MTPYIGLEMGQVCTKQKGNSERMGVTFLSLENSIRKRIQSPKNVLVITHSSCMPNTNEYYYYSHWRHMYEQIYRDKIEQMCSLSH